MRPKNNSAKAKSSLRSLRKLAQEHRLFEGMSEQQIIKKLRESREQLWNEKIAALGARHQ